MDRYRSGRICRGDPFVPIRALNEHDGSPLPGRGARAVGSRGDPSVPVRALNDPDGSPLPYHDWQITRTRPAHHDVGVAGQDIRPPRTAGEEGDVVNTRCAVGVGGGGLQAGLPVAEEPQAGGEFAGDVVGEGDGEGINAGQRRGAEISLHGRGLLDSPILDEDILALVGVVTHQVGGVGLKNHDLPIGGDGRPVCADSCLAPTRGQRDTARLPVLAVVNEYICRVIYIPTHQVVGVGVEGYKATVGGEGGFCCPTIGRCHWCR